VLLADISDSLNRNQEKTRSEAVLKNHLLCFLPFPARVSSMFGPKTVRASKTLKKT
jgi:hypothetical protein